MICRGVYIINKLNDEFNELQKENDELKNYYREKQKRVYFNTFEEFDSKINECKLIIKNELKDLSYGKLRHQISFVLV